MHRGIKMERWGTETLVSKEQSFGSGELFGRIQFVGLENIWEGRLFSGDDLVQVRYGKTRGEVIDQLCELIAYPEGVKV